MEEKETKIEAEQPNPEEEQPQKWYNAMPDRSCILFMIAGAYLAYTGYSLIKNYMDGLEGGGVGFAVAGGVFILIAVGMLILGGRGWLRNDKMKKLRQEAEERAKAAEPKPGMSIQERANLASALDAAEKGDEDVQE